MNPLIFKPIYKERVWGGQKLATRLGRPIPANQPIGESWEIVDREADQSVVAHGAHEGKTLKRLLRISRTWDHGAQLHAQCPLPYFSQVARLQSYPQRSSPPPKVRCRITQGWSKTENWYILEHEPKAQLYLGLVPQTTLEDFSSALEKNQLEPLLAQTKTQAGDSYFIESGTLHAIGGGNLILEIQQNSDTTYRVHDWNRLGLDGKPRDLHPQETLKSLIINDLPILPSRIEGPSAVLADCPHFRISGYRLNANSSPLVLPAQESPRLIHITEGKVTDTLSQQSIAYGDTALQPYTSEMQLIADEDSTVLITDRF